MNKNQMESSILVALLSSVSQLILLILLLSPNSSSAASNAFSATHHFLSSQEIAATLSLLSLSRKRRKRARLSEPDPEQPQQPGLFNRTPDSFKTSFLMTSSTFEWLCALLEPLLECRDPIGSPLNLSADLRLGIGLFRLAKGASYPEISKQFGVSEQVSRFCCKQLCRVLCTNYRFWIEFPNWNHLELLSAGFETQTGLPNCCGVIDCARFKIGSSTRNESDDDNGFDDFQEATTIAAQVVVDRECRILSIVAGFRGDKSDARVLKSSTLYADIENEELLNSPPVSVNGVPVNQYLVGDEGYPLLPWLMVPFVDAMPGSNEEQFNAAHRRMHLSGIRAIDSLKNWGILSKPIREESKMAVAYIGACSILHNGLLMREDYSAMCSGTDDCDQSAQYYRDSTSLEEESVERIASVIRNALATKAREFQDSILSTNSSSLQSLQST